MTLAQKARRAGRLVQLLLTGHKPEELIAELAELYPVFVFAWVEDEGLTVLVPTRSRRLNGDQLLVPSVFNRCACWLIEVCGQQLIVHKCQDGDERDAVAQFQKVLALDVDNMVGTQTRRQMQKIAAGTWKPGRPRLSKWERLMADDA